MAAKLENSGSAPIPVRVVAGGRAFALCRSVGTQGGVEGVMAKSRNWIRLTKKTDPEVPYEPPLWFGDLQQRRAVTTAQTPKERRTRELILKLGDERARYYGMERREFMASGLGMALTMSVVNFVNGCSGGSDGGFAMPTRRRGRHRAAAVSGSGGNAGTGAAAAAQAAARAAARHGRRRGASGNERRERQRCGRQQRQRGRRRHPRDARSRRVRDRARLLATCSSSTSRRIASRPRPACTARFSMSLPQGRCGMGVPGCYSKDEYARAFFLDSDTTVTVLSGIPATDGNNPLTNEQIAESRDYVNALAQETQRVVTPRDGACRTTTTTQQLDGMARSSRRRAPVGAWKCYTPWGPGDGVTGFWLDDPEIGIPFIEQGRELGVKTFACHKGLPLPGFDNNYGDPKDIGVVAKMFPDCKFIAYHSAYQFGSGDETQSATPMGRKTA